MNGLIEGLKRHVDGCQTRPCIHLSMCGLFLQEAVRTFNNKALVTLASELLKFPFLKHAGVKYIVEKRVPIIAGFVFDQVATVIPSLSYQQYAQ